MRLSKLDIQSGRTEICLFPKRKCLIGDDPKSDWRLFRWQQDPTSQPLQPLDVLFSVEDDGFNLLVTLLGGIKRITIADVPLRVDTAVLWLPEHELRVEDHFIFNHLQESELSTLTKEWVFPGKGLLPPVVLLLLGAMLLTALLGFIRQKTTEIATAKSGFPPTAVISPTAAISPTNTPILTATLEPANTAISTYITKPQILVTATATPTLMLTETHPSTVTAAFGVTNSGSTIPLQQSNCFPLEENWIPNRVTITESLGISYTQALIQPGIEFFTLQRIEWVNEADSGGRHNIYVDIREKAGKDAEGHDQWRRVMDRSVLVSWSGGSCLRKIEDISNRNDHPWSDYGANCPMEVPGYAYSVQVYSPHSDIVSRLGLGTLPDPNQSINLREFPILTSYLLVFEKKTSDCNPH